MHISSSTFDPQSELRLELARKSQLQAPQAQGIDIARSESKAESEWLKYRLRVS